MNSRPTTRFIQSVFSGYRPHRRMFSTTAIHCQSINETGNQTNNWRPQITFIGGGAVSCLFASLLTHSQATKQPLKHLNNQTISHSLDQRSDSSVSILSRHLDPHQPIRCSLLNDRLNPVETLPFVTSSVSTLIEHLSKHQSNKQQYPRLIIVSVKGRDAMLRAAQQAQQIVDHLSTHRSTKQQIEHRIDQPSNQVIVMPLMNGVAHVPVFNSFKHADIVFATTAQGAYWQIDQSGNQSKNQHVKTLMQAGDGLTTIVSSVDRASNAVTHLLTGSDIKCQQAPFNELNTVMWRKLAANCVINPLTAMLDVENGGIEAFVSREEGELLVHAVLSEFVQVAATQDVHMSEVDAWNQVMSVVAATAANTSSMRSDVQNGRRTEIDAINGEIVRLGAQHNIATPVNAWLCKLIENPKTAKSALLTWKA